MNKEKIKKAIIYLLTYCLGIVTPIIIHGGEKVIDRWFESDRKIPFSVKDTTTYFPLEKGNVWSYEGEYNYTTSGTTVIKSKRNIKMEVLEKYIFNDITFILVKGGPLVFPYDEDNVPTFGLFIVGNKIYLIKDALEINKILKNKHGFGVLREYYLTFELPLAVGLRFGEVEQIGRADKGYVWNVEKKYTLRTHYSKESEEAFLVSQRAVGWFEEIVFQPYVGIVEQKYYHRGTVDEFDLHLKEFTIKK